MAYLFSSYSRKLVTLVLILSLVPILFISGFLYFDKTETETNNLKERLVSISGIGADNISQWIEQRKINVQSIADNQLVITETKKLLDPSVGIDESFIARFNLENQLNTCIHGHDWLQALKISYPLTVDVIF